MLDKLKADFDKIIALVNKTPAPLQEAAFKMILEQWFNANTARRTRIDFSIALRRNLLVD